MSIKRKKSHRLLFKVPTVGGKQFQFCHFSLALDIFISRQLTKVLHSIRISCTCLFGSNANSYVGFGQSESKLKLNPSSIASNFHFSVLKKLPHDIRCVSIPCNMNVRLSQIQSPRRCRHHVPPKHSNKLITLYSVKSQNTII